MLMPSIKHTKAGMSKQKEFSLPMVNVRSDGLRDASLSSSFPFLVSLGDPWREATLSADNTNFESTPERPIALSDGFHCSDMISYFGDLDPSIRNVQNQALNSISQRLADWVPSD